MKPLPERFWSKVSIRDPDKCWEWTAYTGQKGYGRIRVGNSMALAHRVAWELTNGPIDGRLLVCHHCDNPKCVNPRHLFLGTYLDNKRDSINKGRMRVGVMPGEANPQSRLRVQDVQEIRRLSARGLTQDLVGQMFGFAQGSASRIINRKRWEHI